jgi:hypothetical protein
VIRNIPTVYDEGVGVKTEKVSHHVWNVQHALPQIISDIPAYQDIKLKQWNS